jgi:hypothetical protein
VHQPTKNHNGDHLAEKATTASDDDMDITQCLPVNIITNNMSTSEMGKEANRYSVHKPVLCKKQPEAVDIYSTKEGTVLKHKKKPRMNCNGDSSDEEWKPNQNKMKSSKQRKSRSAKMKCKSLSRRIRTGSTTVAEESPITRYRNICMLYIKSIQFALNMGCVLYSAYFTVKSSCVVSKKIKIFQFFSE